MLGHDCVRRRLRVLEIEKGDIETREYSVLEVTVIEHEIHGELKRDGNNKSVGEYMSKVRYIV